MTTTVNDLTKITYLLTHIIDTLDFDSFMKFSQSNSLSIRKELRRLYSDDYYYKKLKIKIMKECIDQFELDLETNILGENHNFFLKHGYDSNSEYDTIILKYTKKLLSELSEEDFYRVSKDIGTEINDYSPQGIIDRYPFLNDHIVKLADEYQHKIFEEEYRNRNRFLTQFYKSYDNTVEFVKEIDRYIEEYKKYIDEESINKFKKCLYKKLNLLDIFIFRISPKKYDPDFIKTI